MKLATRALMFAVAAAATLAVAQGPIDVFAAAQQQGQQGGRQGGRGQGPNTGAPARGWPPPDATPEERAKVEAALPATAPAKPQKARKLLVYDLNIGYAGHRAIPHTNLAVQLMGQKTGAYEATLSRDPAVLAPESLRQYDAVFLNNTNGNIFATPELREAFAAYVKNGGGLVGNHATTMVSTHWPEFTEIIGASGAYHREANEKLTVRVEDPANAIVKVFDGKPFEFTDEFYRFPGSFSRQRSRVLLSVDPNANDMTQGRCFGVCLTPDNDYPVAWISQYGKGRVFYTTLGHAPDAFYDPRVNQMFLAAIQYALGDLQADATPQPRSTARFDELLATVAQYDWGKDPAAIRQLELELPLVTATPADAVAAEDKLLKVLQSNVSLAAKDVICRQLAYFGTARSVPVLQELLKNQNTQAMARYALDGIQGAAMLSRPGAR